METANLPPRRWPKNLVIALAGLALLCLIGLGIKSMMGGKSGKPRKPPTVTLMPDKPPPPPPKEEKKPEPPKEDKKEVKVVQPTEQAPQPAQNEPLKMEGVAGEGGGPFGAGTVGREYSGGSIGGIGGAGSFAGRLQRHFQEQLSRTRKLRESDYKVTVKIWLRRDGSIERAELAGTTGFEKLDQLLRESLQQIPAMREAMPENLVQPIRIRVTNRGSV
jgi:protein TonB